jgi:signal transduction histidine kinase
MIALALFLIPLAVAVFKLNMDQARADLKQKALLAVVAVDPNFSRGDHTELPPTAAPARLGLYNSNGRLVLGDGPREADSVVRQALGGRAAAYGRSAGFLTTSIPISSSESVTGAIRAAVPLSSVWQSIAAAWILMLAVAALAVTIGVFFARSLARRISDPLATLTRVAKSIGSGDFGARTRPSGLPEIDHAAEALNVTATKLAELVRRERQLSGNASHQLRTPLAGLRVVLENALSDPAADMRAAAVIAIERADLLEKTIEEIIALTREPPSGQQVDAARQLDSAGDRWRERLSGVERDLYIDADPVVDETSLQQILDALIENAILHGSGTVTLRARLSHGVIAFDVEDEGRGIADGDEIFMHGVSHSGGTGLGLALARQLVVDQGGQLLLSAREPHTRFTVILPVSPSGKSWVNDSY